MSPHFKSHTTQFPAHALHAHHFALREYWQRFALLFLAVVAMVMYVAQVNSLSMKGFAIHDLEKRIEAVEKENQRMQLAIAGFQSSDEFSLLVKSIGLTDEGDTEYMTIPRVVAMQ